jgi:hypothetical protein
MEGVALESLRQCRPLLAARRRVGGVMSISREIEYFADPEMASSLPAFLKAYEAAKEAKVSAQLMADALRCNVASEILKNGVRILNVSEAECNLYEKTDVQITAEDWHQSYPVIFVKLATFAHLIVVSKFDFWVNLLVFQDGYLDHLFIHKDIEQGLTSNGKFGGGNADISPEIVRAAICACLRLANYGEEYTRFPQAAHRIIVKDQSGYGKPKRTDLIPQVIQLRNPEQDQEEEQQETEHGRYGQRDTHNRPHWRRGYFRNQRVGAGRLARKQVWIRPTLVNREFLEGDKIAVSVFNN